ncbi:hypothetical protein IKS57_03365, partial [bacterium]|nr:hypothetical protein [bacterium]
MISDKNILLIVEDEFDTVGGVQTYNKLLIQIVEKYFKHVNFDIYLPNKSIKNLDRNESRYFGIYKYYYNDLICNSPYINMLFYHIYARITINALLKKKKYDLIINSTGIYFKKLAKLDNYFLIQHNSFKAYQCKEYKGTINYIKSAIKKIFGAIFPFDKTKNIILFDEKNKELYYKLFKNNNANIYCIPLCSENKGKLDAKENTVDRKNI